MGQGESRHQLEQELNRVRRQEQERAAADLKNAIGRVESQFQQELKKLSDANLKREKEQQQVITKLEEQEKKCSALVESLRSNLAETQEQLATFDKRVRQLEAQVLEEQKVSASRKTRAEELEDDVERLTKDLQTEKGGREEALAKIVALEHVISRTTKDLDSERQRLKGARDKITTLEKQLRSLCSTAEEIKHLFDQQQEKLEEMYKALQQKQIDQINGSIGLDPTHHVEEAETRWSTTSSGTMEPHSTSLAEREANQVGVEASTDDHAYDNNIRETQA